MTNNPNNKYLRVPTGKDGGIIDIDNPLYDENKHVAEKLISILDVEYNSVLYK